MGFYTPKPQQRPALCKAQSILTVDFALGSERGQSLHFILSYLPVTITLRRRCAHSDHGHDFPKSMPDIHSPRPIASDVVRSEHRPILPMPIVPVTSLDVIPAEALCTRCAVGTVSRPLRSLRTIRVPSAGIEHLRRVSTPIPFWRFEEGS